jgi:hypothetical protein
LGYGPCDGITAEVGPGVWWAALVPCGDAFDFRRTALKFGDFFHYTFRKQVLS